MDAAMRQQDFAKVSEIQYGRIPVSYTHLRAHETVLDLVCRLLLEKKHEVLPLSTDDT